MLSKKFYKTAFINLARLTEREFIKACYMSIHEITKNKCKRRFIMFIKVHKLLKKEV